MRSKINYQLETDRILAQLPAERTPTLFLHACCAPCSSYVLEYLSRYFAITLFFYNPNISPEAEYLHRKAELCRLVQELPLGNPVTVVDGDYLPERFYALAKGLEQEPERGAGGNFSRSMAVSTSSTSIRSTFSNCLMRDCTCTDFVAL